MTTWWFDLTAQLSINIYWRLLPIMRFRHVVCQTEQRKYTIKHTSANGSKSNNITKIVYVWSRDFFAVATFLCNWNFVQRPTYCNKHLYRIHISFFSFFLCQSVKKEMHHLKMRDNLFTKHLDLSPTRTFPVYILNKTRISSPQCLTISRHSAKRRFEYTYIKIALVINDSLSPLDFEWRHSKRHCRFWEMSPHLEYQYDIVSWKCGLYDWEVWYWLGRLKT